MKVALYDRVSKALEQNPLNQLIELRKYAEAYSHEVFGEFVDEISSKDTRPQKEEILRYLRLGEIKGVIYWSLDRWGRTMSELVIEMEQFREKGWIMVSLKDGIDLSTSAGRLSAHILAAMANFERERIRERTLLGLARARAQGKRLGRPRKYPLDASWSEKTTELSKVHHEIRNKTRSMKVKEKHCVLCGSPNKLEYHHPDYDKPKLAVTLCRNCHYKVHGKRGAENP